MGFDDGLLMLIDKGVYLARFLEALLKDHLTIGLVTARIKVLQVLTLLGDNSRMTLLAGDARSVKELLVELGHLSCKFFTAGGNAQFSLCGKFTKLGSCLILGGDTNLVNFFTIFRSFLS